MKHRIIFATGNAGKMREIRAILGDLGCEIVSMKEAGAEPEIVENGSTFGENAEIKAQAVWKCTGDIVLADDSGLEIDYLNKEYPNYDFEITDTYEEEVGYCLFGCRTTIIKNDIVNKAINKILFLK